MMTIQEVTQGRQAPLTSVLICCPTMASAMLACEDVQVVLDDEGLHVFKGEDPDELDECPFCGAEV